MGERCRARGCPRAAISIVAVRCSLPWQAYDWSEDVRLCAGHEHDLAVEDGLMLTEAVWAERA